MGGNIFATPEGGLDTSTEALEERWEEDATQEVTEGESVDEVDDEDDTDDADESDDDGMESSEEDDESTDDDESDEDGVDAEATIKALKLDGKSPEQLAKIIADQRSMTARQSEEVGQLRGLVEQQQAQLQQLAVLLQNQQHDSQEIDVSNWEDDLRSNPQAVYGQALELLDRGQIDIGQMEDLLDAAMELHPQLGRRMARDFDRRVILAQTNQQLQPVQDNAYEGVVEKVTGELWHSAEPEVKHDIQEYHKEIAALLDGVDLGKTKQEVRQKLEQALVVVRGHDPVRSFRYKQALEALKTDSQVEAGTGLEREPKKSDADKTRERIFSRRKSDPAATLFADLT